ncbi:OLC1v1001391C1 [Oldenlandia corymbosa var. corymbosa]|uniref:OLC1v1001391C1 n=1 Tax=Oldenlandia corymbosa var. corymbosa TaxID=529605 RepID=A0AAV1D567_OLDCO|nr:OLC1v1001391C1 [Oldenlandia corymbosa var. corymbosa]
MLLLTDEGPTNSDGRYSQEISLMSGDQVANDKSWSFDTHDLMFGRTVRRSAVYNDTHRLGVVCSANPYTLSPEEYVDQQSEDVKSTSSEEVDEKIDCRDRYNAKPQDHGDNSFTDNKIMGHRGQDRLTILKIDVVETSEMKLSSIEDGLKDMDTSLNDHGHIRHSSPSHQVLGSSPLEHEEQCCLNSSGIDVIAASKMKLSSIEGNSRNVFQNQKNESSDNSRQSGFVADIASDFSNLSQQEQGRLIMLDSEETKDTSSITDEMSEGSICNDRQHGAATATASVPSQFSKQDKSRLTAFGVDQAKISTTTSLAVGEVPTELICIDSDQTPHLDSSADSISLEQLDQERLKTQDEERANVYKIKLLEVESVPKKGGIGGNKSQVRHTDSSGDRAEQTVASSLVKRRSNNAWIYDKRESMRSSSKRHKDKSMKNSFCHADRATSTNSLSGADSLCVDAESDGNQEEKCIAWLDYGAAVKWKFELIADPKILKSLGGQGKRRCTRAYAKLFGSTPKRIRAFHVEKIVVKKDVGMKPKVDANSEGNKDDHSKKDDKLEKGQAELKFVKLVEEKQIQSQLKDDQLVHAALNETNVESTVNKEESCKLIGYDTVCSSAISNPVFIQFGSQPEVRCDQPITFLLIVQGRDLLAVNNKEGAKEDGSDTVSNATMKNPVLKKFNNQLLLLH